MGTDKLIKFDESLLTGVEEMDNQHKKLVEAFNKVYSLIKEGKKEEALKVFIKDLKEYTEFHLKEEEKFLEEINYPEIEKHKRLHQQFRKIVFSLEEKIKEGNPESLREAISIAWGWIHVHIAKSDKKYGEYYKNLYKNQS
ncbi:MAG: bacteriohemerythrin [Aquifex sp.]|nr:MAG: bacteriohemerythrin [Aquifex sp.]